MTRILRLLLIAAVALPLWQPTAAQELASVNDDAVTNKHISKAVCEVKDLSKMKVASLADALGMESDATDNASAVVDVNDKQPVGKWKFKTRSTQHASTAVKVTKSRAAIPEGYASITLAAGNVWNDGTGYQMLLDANATAYGTIIPATGALTTSGDVPASTYAEFEYKIPENADGALTTTNMILDSQATILIPAGTYDWCITNPSPEDRMWIASEQGDVQGRYDNYVFEAGLSYVFTVTKVGQNDNIVIEITNPDYSNPTNLAATNILDFEAMLTWTPGGDENAWNVEYKKKADFEWISAGTANDANYLLNDLSMATEYQARVQGVYGNGVSGWALVSFTTDNDPAELCEPEEMGEITYSLSDRYNDGWNGASIQIVDAETDLVITTLTISSGNSASGTVSLCYGRTVNFVWTAGTYPEECSFTITDPDGEVIASKTASQTITNGSTFATYTMRKPGQTESLDFGVVDVNSTKTLTAKILNESSVSVQATLAVSTPFSVESSTVTLQPGLTAIPVTFTPTEARNYHGTLTVTIGGETITIALTGVGNMNGPEAIRDKAFFEGISYKWKEWKDSDTTEPTGPEHTNTLADVATDPDQIIAMMKKIYTDPTIPGSFKRGFSSTGADEAGNLVNYPGVGTISHSGSSYNTGYSWENDYGWGINGNLKIVNNKSFYYYGNNNYPSTYYADYCYMDSMQYKPKNEGITMLMVETVDDFKYSNVTAQVASLPEGTASYEKLRTQIQYSVKSARVITEAKRTGNGLDKGTLFKIDADKLNKFFLLSKGQVRRVMNSQIWIGEQTTYTAFCANPAFIRVKNGYGTTIAEDFIDGDTGDPFYHMFEQFSPTSVDSEAGVEDVYQSLINMQPFSVKHDCMGITNMNHHFMMYGEVSDANDCQDVRDMMFFVPDYRMMNFGSSTFVDDDSNRDRGLLLRYLNYHRQHMPTLGLYVIRQDEITPTTQADDYYMLQLNWRTNLDDFLPSDEQEFELLQVVVDEETGEEKYVPVYYMNAQGQYTDASGNPSETPVPIMLAMEAGRVKNYPYVYVARQSSSQQVTYAIRGRDTGHFLSLQISNQQSYIIPGLDPNEMIALKDASHYSRYNPDNEKNCYSNRISIANTALGLENANITDGENGTKLTVVRSHTETVNGVTNTISEPVAYITFNNHAASNRSITITMANQSAKSDYPKGKSDVEAGNVQYYAGYHANNGNVEGNGNWSQNYNVTNTGYVDFGNLNIYDNFVVDVAGNTHPVSYAYRLESNYQGTPTMVYLNAPYPYTKGDEVWYAWTWNNDNDGKWLLGTAGENGLLSFGPVKSNIIFARMNPNADGIPRWNGNGETGDDRAVWDQTGNLTANAGKTFSINGWLTGEWGSDVINETAYSNAFRVPIYKTASEINNAFSLIEVKGDKNHAIKVEDLTFSERVQYSSKTEILRYDVYRWPAGETRYIVNTVGANDAEQDLAPDGIAGNQGEGYTVTMNDVDGDYYYHGGEIAVSSGYAWAKFVDYYPAKVAKNTEEAKAYVYAPVVETFTVGKNVVGAQRTDYNTYGGPLQKAAVGVLDIDNPVYQISDYSWLKGNDRYAYYTVELPIKTDAVPAGYKIYMVRAWREIDTDLLDEPLEAFASRKSGDYMFEEMLGKTEEGITEFLPQGGVGEYQPGTHMRLGAAQVAAQNVSGEDIAGVYRGTFGARKVRTATGYNDGTIEDLKMNFRVRLYFTPEVSAKGAAPKAADSDKIYYIAEYTTPFTINGGITTGLENLNARQVVGVKYYNVAGIESDTPFQGVNIMVTRYSDGSSTTTKILK